MPDSDDSKKPSGEKHEAAAVIAGKSDVAVGKVQRRHSVLVTTDPVTDNIVDSARRTAEEVERRLAQDPPEATQPAVAPVETPALSPAPAPAPAPTPALAAPKAASTWRGKVSEQREALAKYRALEGVPDSGDSQYQDYRKRRVEDPTMVYIPRRQFRTTGAKPGPKSSPRNSRWK